MPEFTYSRRRHGGWYVDNVYYPSGAVGCVSRNYPDKKWRIVCDERQGDHTYPNRDAAARAERDLIATTDVDRWHWDERPSKAHMTPQEAWLYAASWGSLMRNGDPGACMYGFDESFTVQSEKHRADCLAWVENECRPELLAHPEEYDPGELAQLDSFVAALKAAPSSARFGPHSAMTERFTSNEARKTR